MLTRLESMKCSNCNEKILISDAEVCPYCGSTNLVPNSTLTIKDKKEIKKMETEGRILDLAKKYEELEMWDKAG
jgi:RNA polymerase subunit RPABC4/transcription elongation factor Spt4